MFEKLRKKLKKNKLLFREYVYKNKTYAKVKNIKNAFWFYSKKELLFIHIPKTAGVSIHYALFNVDSLGHIPITDYIKIFGRIKVNSLFIFCFVRNPYDRLYSAYSYLKKGGRGNKSDFEYQSLLKNINDFEDFVINYLDKKGFKEICHFLPQSFFIKNKNNEFNIDFIGKFENLEEDFKVIYKKLRLQNIQIPSRNMNSNRKEFTLSNAVKEKIYEIYKEDFLNFNYEK